MKTNAREKIKYKGMESQTKFGYDPQGGGKFLSKTKGSSCLATDQGGKRDMQTRPSNLRELEEKLCGVREEKM